MRLQNYILNKSFRNNIFLTLQKSMFQGSAWTYSNARKQWYLHQFAPEQPDLNYRNIKVQTEMKVSYPTTILIVVLILIN